MKYFILFLLFFSINAVCYAEDISISADVNRREIALDEQVTLTVVITGSVSNIPKPQIPDLKGFTAYSSGRSQNISIINGRVTSSISFAYVLVPNDTGDYTLGPFTVNYKGKAYSAGPIDVKVIGRARSQVQAPSYTSSQTPGAPYGQDPQKPGKELFIETYVDKLTAYVNEQITLTFSFYQSVNLFENPVYAPASTTGFWTEDMPPQKKYYKSINGKKYLVTEIKTALFATSSGEFTIGPARLEASVEDLERFSSRSSFSIFDRGLLSILKRGKPVILMTDPIALDILPLPGEGKPLNFKGDVGRFDITASVDKDTVEENEPVTLKIKIKGEGNIKTVSSPSIPRGGADIRFYDSGSSENISKAEYVVQGEKVFEKVVIPKNAGSFTVGPIEYSYFDPVKEEYVEKKIRPITINAAKSNEEPVTETTLSMLSIPGLTKEEVRLLKKDIRYIKTYSPDLKPAGSFLYKNKIFFSINAIPLFILISFYIYGLYRERLRTDVGYARSRRARSIASRRLKGAKALMLSGNIKEFYAEIYKAAIEYIADKLNIPHPSITKDALEKKLEEKGISREAAGKLKELFDICDMARFASGRFTKEDMQRTTEEAVAIIAEFERVK